MTHVEVLGECVCEGGEGRGGEMEVNSSAVNYSLPSVELHSGQALKTQCVYVCVCVPLSKADQY